jgi:hypothetical protein
MLRMVRTGVAGCASLAAAVVLAGSALAAETAQVTLAPTPLAANAGLQVSQGWSEVDIDGGNVSILVELPNGVALPEATVLEGWVVDRGRLGGPGPMTHASPSTNARHGPAFGDPEFERIVSDAPYALSTGKLSQVAPGQFVGSFHIDNNLTPYNVVVVTLEGDANGIGYDPRPGTPVLVGPIEMGMSMSMDMNPSMDMNMGMGMEMGR